MNNENIYRHLSTSNRIESKRNELNRIIIIRFSSVLLFFFFSFAIEYYILLTHLKLRH